MSDERDIRYRALDTTEDTGDPVLRVSVRGTESKMDVILDREERVIRVWSVGSENTGDMKAMLDQTVRELGWRDVMFLSPLDEYKTINATKLKDRLSGFETTLTEIQKPDGSTEKQKRYVGKWMV